MTRERTRSSSSYTRDDTSRRSARNKKTRSPPSRRSVQYDDDDDDYYIRYCCTLVTDCTVQESSETREQPAPLRPTSGIHIRVRYAFVSSSVEDRMSPRRAFCERLRKLAYRQGRNSRYLSCLKNNQQ